MNAETFDDVMESVCDMCHWPFVCGEGALDEKCANCPAEKKIREALKNA